MTSHRETLTVKKLKLQVWEDTEDDFDQVKCLKCVLNHLLTLKASRSPWLEELRALQASGSIEVSGRGSGSPMITRTFRMFVPSSSSRIKASVCVKGVEVMESCS